MPSLSELVEAAGALANAGAHAESLARFESASQLLPSSCDLTHNIGTTLHHLSRTREAVSRWKAAGRQCPLHGPSTSALRDVAAELGNRASAHTLSGRPDSAVDDWSLAVLAAPSNAEYRTSLGDANAALGRRQAALQAYEHALSMSPTLGRAYVGMGRLGLQRQSAYEEERLLGWLRHGVALLPQSGEAWMLLGAAESEEAARGAGGSALQAEAVASLRRAVRYLPRNADAAWLLGDALAASGQRRLSVISLANAIRLSPRHIEAYSSLARVVSYEVLSARAATLALRCYRAALRVAPTHPETLHNLGEYLHTQGEPALAVRSFEGALRAAPTSGPTLLSLGENLQRLCRLDEARRRYSQAVAAMPRNARAQVHTLLPVTRLEARHGGERRGRGSRGGGGVTASEADAADDPVTGGGGARDDGWRFPASAAELRVESVGGAWHERAARVLALHGVVVLPALLPLPLCADVLRMIDTWPSTAEGTSITTRQPHRRRHQALPMQRNASGRAAAALEAQLAPLLSRALGTSATRLVECGFLVSEPGAQAQAFHADTSPPALDACEGAALKVQLALVDVDQDMGPLEVVPGSHHHGRHAKRRAAGGPTGDAPAAVRAVVGADDPPAMALRLLVQPGDVTIYWSTVQHRGSANVGVRARPTFHIAAIGEGAAPTGMPYTVLVDDILAKYGHATLGHA